jgi:hypothetical protein
MTFDDDDDERYEGATKDDSISEAVMSYTTSNACWAVRCISANVHKRTNNHFEPQHTNRALEMQLFGLSME